MYHNINIVRTQRIQIRDRNIIRSFGQTIFSLSLGPTISISTRAANRLYRRNTIIHATRRLNIHIKTQTQRVHIAQNILTSYRTIRVAHATNNHRITTRRQATNRRTTTNSRCPIEVKQTNRLRHCNTDATKNTATRRLRNRLVSNKWSRTATTILINNKRRQSLGLTAKSIRNKHLNIISTCHIRREDNLAAILANQLQIRTIEPLIAQRRVIRRSFKNHFLAHATCRSNRRNNNTQCTATQRNRLRNRRTIATIIRRHPNPNNQLRTTRTLNIFLKSYHRSSIAHIHRKNIRRHGRRNIPRQRHIAWYIQQHGRLKIAHRNRLHRRRRIATSIRRRPNPNNRITAFARADRHLLIQIQRRRIVAIIQHRNQIRCHLARRTFNRQIRRNIRQNRSFHILHHNNLLRRRRITAIIRRRKRPNHLH